MSTPSPADLPIRRLTLRDLPACADLSESRGWLREEHKWSFLLTAGNGYGIDDPAGGLVAACVVTPYGPPGRTEFAAIGMVLVAEGHERQGIGRRLMRHVLSVTGTTPLTLYATENGRPLYEKVGFTITGRSETVSGLFQREEKPARITARAATAEDLPGILRLDGEVFGADRTPVITRLPAFTDHLCVAEDRGELIGYAGAWPTTDTQVVGPLIARDTETAKSLVSFLAARTDRPLRTDIDVRHAELLAWLKQRGLASVSVQAVMAYGTAELPGDWTRRFAPLTVAAG